MSVAYNQMNSTQSNQNLRTTGVFLGICLFLMSIAASKLPVGLIDKVLLITFLGAIASWLVIGKQPTWYSPSNIMLAGYLTLGFLHPWVRNGVDGYTSGQLGWMISTNLVQASLILNCGVFAYAIGYTVRKSLSSDEVAIQANQTVFMEIPKVIEIALWLFWLMCMLILLKTFGISVLTNSRSGTNVSALEGGSSYLYYSSYLLLVPAISNLLKPVSIRPKYWTWVLFISSQLLALISGSRIVLLPGLLTLMIALIIRRGKNISRSLLIVTVIAGLILLVGMRLWRESHDTYKVKEGRNSVSYMLEDVFSGQDTAMLDNLAVLVAAREFGVVQHPLPFTPYISAITAPIPRELWHGKPISVDQELNAKILPTQYQVGYGFSFTVFGEAIYCAGFLGMLFVAFLLGYFSNYLYQSLLRFPGSKIGIVAIALIPQTLVVLRGSITADFPRFAMIAAPAILLTVIKSDSDQNSFAKHLV